MNRITLIKMNVKPYDTGLYVYGSIRLVANKKKTYQKRNIIYSNVLLFMNM